MGNEQKEKLYTLGNWKVKPGKSELFIHEWLKFAKFTSNKFPDTGKANLVQDLADPTRLISFGNWENSEIIQEWRNTEEFKNFFLIAKELCEDVQPGTFKVVAAT